MPMHGNILTHAGIGRDPITGPIAFWAAMTFVAVSGAILLLMVLRRGFICLLPNNEIQNSYTLAFALALTTISVAPLPFVGLSWQGFYDRYVIAFLPWLMLAAVAAGDPIKNFTLRSMGGIVAIVTLLATSVFSIAATHDYLASHRARWLALGNLMHSGVKPEQIDGGFEFNGWYLYSDDFVRRPHKPWYWVIDNEYLVSPFGLFEGYIKLETYPVQRWLPWGTADILVQRRATLELGPSISTAPAR